MVVDETTNVASTIRAFEEHRDLLASVENRWAPGGSGEALVSKYAYVNDDLARRTSVVRTGTAFTAAHFDLWGYNDRNELTGSERFAGADPQDLNTPVPDLSFGYEYDWIGNRKTSAAGSSFTAYTSNALNQYTRTLDPNETTFTYDLDGNLTADGTFAYAWDAENRLTRVEPTSPSAGSKKLVFTYDYLNRRVRKQVFEYADGAWPTTPSQDLRFVYDGWNMLLVLDGLNGNAVVRKYTWGLDLSDTLRNAGGIGGLLALQDVTQSKDYLYLYDGNGNVAQLLDAADGEIVASYEYDPYGGTLAAQGAYASANPFRFSTKYFDGEIGLYYYGYRYYSARLGRWMNRDPVYDPGFRWGRQTDKVNSRRQPNAERIGNIYRYAANRPMTEVDAFGLMSKGDGSGTCEACCQDKGIYDPMLGVGGGSFTVTVEPGQTPKEACSASNGLFLSSGSCENPCGGKAKVPIWVCGRPIDIVGLGWTYYIPIIGPEHGYICCDSANGNNCRNFWTRPDGKNLVSQEAKCTGECQKVMVCPEEKDEKCSGQYWARPYCTASYNCNTWARDYGNKPCGVPPGQ